MTKVTVNINKPANYTIPQMTAKPNAKKLNVNLGIDKCVKMEEVVIINKETVNTFMTVMT